MLVWCQEGMWVDKGSLPIICSQAPKKAKEHTHKYIQDKATCCNKKLSPI